MNTSPGDLCNTGAAVASQPDKRPDGPYGLADFGFFAPLEAVAAALDGRDELLEVDLERVEDVVGVVLGAQADLALAGAGVLDDLLGLALGLLDDLLARRSGGSARHGPP